MKKIIYRFSDAVYGISDTFRNRFNLRFHLMASTLILASGFYFKIGLMEWGIVLFCIASVLSAELINTSIDAGEDLFTNDFPKRSHLSRKIAGATLLVTAIVAAFIFCIVFFPKIIVLF